MSDSKVTPTKEYFIFLAAPNDVNAERKAVRRFFHEFNRTIAKPKWNIRFSVIDWENHTSIGVERAQALMKSDVLRKYQNQLALVIGIIGQRFGSITGITESGTQEEFNGLLQLLGTEHSPNISWFFKRTQYVMIETDYDDVSNEYEDRQLAQWQQVKKFRKRCQEADPLFKYHEYVDLDSFIKTLEQQLRPWLDQQKDHWMTQSLVNPTLDLIPASFPRGATSKNKPNQIGTGGSIIQLADFRRAVITMRDSKSLERPVAEKNVMFEQPVELANYYSWLIEHGSDLSISSIDPAELDRNPMALADLYIDLNVLPAKSVLAQEADNSLDSIQVLEDSPRIVLMGDPGSGKTTFINYMSLTLAKRRHALPSHLSNKIPVKIVLSQLTQNDAFRKPSKADANLIWDVFINNLSKRLDRNQVIKIAERLKFEMTQGNLIILLDGLDEVPDLKNNSLRRRVIDATQDIATNYSEDNRIILTSRTYAYHQMQTPLDNFNTFKLDYFDLAQIETYIRKWYAFLKNNQLITKTKVAATQREFIDKIKSQTSVQDLAERPLLLTLMADIYHNTGSIPNNRDELYEQSLALLLKRRLD